MAGAMRKIGEYLGLLEDTGRYDDDRDAYRDDYRDDPRDGADAAYPAYADDETSQHAAVARPVRRVREPAGAPARGSHSASVSELAERRRPVASAPAAVAELSRITTVHPSTYNEARVVGEHFRAGTPVIMNLTEMSDADAKRLVDFAAGLVFATHGTIERVTNRVFLLSPPNVSVAAEDKQRIAEGGFFNQS